MDDAKIDWIIANCTKYYEILGVERTADAATIRRSYYRLTLQLHPDKTSGNRRAEDACRAVIRAYEVLKDANLRMMYDEKGAEGVDILESMGIPSFRELMTLFFWHAVAKMLDMTARRMHCVDLLDQSFAWVRHFVPNRPEDDFAQFNRVPRRAARHFVARVFAALLLVTLCTSIGLRLWYRGDSGAHAQTHAFEPMLRKSSDEPVSEYMYRRYVNNSIAVCRPVRTSDETAERLVNRWVAENCPMESLLAWASQERYEPTATIRVQRQLHAQPSPNRATKRKWPPRNWRPKFAESFSVKSADQLFTRSPLCSPFNG